MRKFTIVLLLLPVTLWAQSIAEVDSLLVNASYQQALEAVSGLSQKAAPGERALLEARRAEALVQLGRYEEAEQVLRQLPSPSDPYQKAVIHSTYGLLYMNQGQHEKATEALSGAIALFENSGHGASLEAAKAISNLGLVFNATGNYVRAQEQLTMALAMREKILKGDHELIAASYNDLGLAFANTDTDKALDCYEKAYRIYQTLHGAGHPKLAIASINNGLMYRTLQLYGDAINNFENALKIWEKTYAGAHPTKAFTLMNLGQTYMEMQNHDVARQYFEKSLAMFRDTYGARHPDISQVLNALGNIALSGDHFDEALRFYQEAIIANVNGFDNESPDSNPSPENHYNGYVLLYSMLYKAEGFEKRYFGKTLRLSDLKTSLRILQHCDTLVDELRKHSTNESDKIALGVIASDVYADGVRIATEIAANSLRKAPYLELAFYFAEKSKSAVLLESISESNAKSFAGIPSSLMDEERELKAAIALTNRRLSQKPSVEEEKKLREAIYRLNRSYEEFVRRLERDYPQYFNLKYNSTSPSMQSIRDLLGPATAVLSYFIDEKRSRLYTFMITRRRYRIVEQTLPGEFNKFVSGFRNSIYYHEPAAFRLTARNLGKLLIPPLPATISDLVVLPTGRLSVIPFEALLTARPGDNTDFSNLPYLLHKFSVRYEFSASLILQKAGTPLEQRPASILLCAPVNFEGTAGLPELPGTKSEVNEISRLFSERNLQADLRLFEEAKESLIKENGTAGFSLVHLATHGVVDEYRPELSRIFLRGDGNTEDGSLFSGEIYNLRLKANLVTLSACQTGLGKISKGEGVIGLSRALVYAGARNMIVSYWSVSDDSTSQLMKDFYRRLLDASSAASYYQGLREAKLNLLTNEAYAAPYYWAPFILIGF